MRFRLMYLFSFILSAVAVWNFRTSQVVANLFGMLSYAFVIFGIMMSLFFVLSTTVGASAALRRSRQYASTIGKSFLWILVTGVVCLGICFVVFRFMDTGFFNSHFSVDSEIRSLYPSASIFDDVYAEGLKKIQFSSLQFIYCAVLSLVAFGFLFGYYLKPDLRIVRPAYTVTNSIVEVAFRFMYTICELYIVLLFFVSGGYFAYLLSIRGLIGKCLPLIADLGIVTAAVVLVVLPVLFVIFTKFRENPIAIMWSAFITSLISVFSRNQFFTLPIMEVIHRHENNSMKKTVVTSGNILFLFSRLGSAVIAYIALCVLIGNGLSPVQSALLPLVCLGASLFSGMYSGTEVIFIASMAALLKFNVSPDVLYLAGVLTPILNAFASFIDTFSINLGANALDMPAQDLEALILK